MSRALISSAAVAIALGLAMTPALSQSAPGGNAKAVAQSKMRNSEDPSSPEMQQAATKQADCTKKAKAEKLSGAKRRAFVKDCMK